MREHGTNQVRTSRCPDDSVPGRRSDVFSLFCRQTRMVFLLALEKPLKQGCSQIPLVGRISQKQEKQSLQKENRELITR